MAQNPWIYKDFYIVNGSVELVLVKRDVRGGFDLGGLKEKKEVMLDNIDYNNRDKNYWKNVYDYINRYSYYNKNNIEIPQKDANSIIKRIKRHRYFERLSKKKIIRIKENDIYRAALINKCLYKSMKNSSLKSKLSLFVKMNVILLMNLFD